MVNHLDVIYVDILDQSIPEIKSVNFIHTSCHKLQNYTWYKENFSTGSIRLKHDNSRASNSSEVVSCDIIKLLYRDVGWSAVVCTRISSPGLICR